MNETDEKRERSTVMGRAMAEDWEHGELLWPGVSQYLIQEGALAAWAEVVSGHDLYCDEFVMGFKARATELTRD